MNSRRASCEDQVSLNSKYIFSHITFHFCFYNFDSQTFKLCHKNMCEQVPLTNIQNSSNGTKNLEHECDVPANIATRNQEIDVRRKKPKKAKNYADEKLAVARLDLMFLLVFPFFFLLFNLIYWISFLYIIPDWQLSQYNKSLFYAL